MQVSSPRSVDGSAHQWKTAVPNKDSFEKEMSAKHTKYDHNSEIVCKNHSINIK